MWRLVLAKITTWTEMETTWHLGLVLDANEALDIQQEAERRANERARIKADDGGPG
jgi:hypothetical protein